MTDVAVDLHAVSLRYANTSQPAVDAVDLRVSRGEFVTLLGPSGCGKTSLLRLVAGLEAASAGQVWIDGRDATGLGAAERPVSLVFQNYALFPHLDVLDNIGYGLRAAGRGEDDVRLQSGRVLEMLGLHELAARKPAELSGGQQQRVALARALALEPSVLLLDEPLSNLDQALRRQVREELRALQRRLRLSVLHVTHDQGDAMAVSDRVVVMHQGRIAQQGPPRELYEQPRTAFVAGFMGDARLLTAQVDDQGQVRLGALPLPWLRGLAPGVVTLMVRPEAWRGAPAATSGVPAVVKRVAYLGRCIEYTLDSDLGELLWVSALTQGRHELGAPLSLHLVRHGVAVLPDDGAAHGGPAAAPLSTGFQPAPVNPP